MQQIQIEKAAKTLKTDRIEDVQINIHQSVDLDALEYPHAIVDVFKADAQSLFDALRGSLPGGTFDQLLSLMLAEKASHFIVPHFDGKKD